jgi:hypothetical protein
MRSKVLIAAAAMVGLFGVAVPPAQAEIPRCQGYGSSGSRVSDYKTTNSYIGVPSTFTYSVTDRENCIVSATAIFMATDGTDVQRVPLNLSAGPVRVATAQWTPKAPSYRVDIDGTVTFYREVYSEYSSALLRNARFGPFPVLPQPAAPGAPTAEIANRTATITWTFPNANSGFVARYIVVSAATKAVVCEVPAGSYSCVANDLADGSQTFVIAAWNQLNQGGTAGTTPVVVGPPNAPGFSSVKNLGKSVQLAWATQTGTSAVPAVYRVYNQAGKEVCGIQVSASDLSQGKLSCKAPLSKFVQRFKLKVETALGNAESPLSGPLKTKVR